MHIADGIISGPVLVTGAILAAGGVAWGLRAVRVDQTPRVAMVAAVIFTASLIHVPVGPASTHLILNGLAGILLGWAVFPALAVALWMQAMMFQFGGLTVLGINILVVAVPALFAHYMFQYLHRPGRGSRMTFAVGATLGGFAVAFSILLQSTALALSGSAFVNLALILALAHIPVVIVDGFITGTVLVFLSRTRPELLGGDH